MPVSESTKLENSRDFYRDFNESGYTQIKSALSQTYGRACRRARLATSA
jgi:hypothetical protein